MCNQVVIMNIRDYAILAWQKKGGKKSLGGEGKKEKEQSVLWKIKKSDVSVLNKAFCMIDADICGSEVCEPPVKYKN